MQLRGFFIYYPLVFILIIMTGCRLERGKVYFDELGLDPITVYTVSPLKSALYCLAEEDISGDERWLARYREELEKVKAHPERENWGRLVCLAFSDRSTIVQLRETIRALQLIIAAGHTQVNGACAFKKLLEEKMRLQQKIAAAATTKKNLEKEHEKALRYCREEIGKGYAAISVEKMRVRELEDKVRKLQEIELMLHPKK